MQICSAILIYFLECVCLSYNYERPEQSKVHTQLKINRQKSCQPEEIQA